MCMSIYSTVQYFVFSSSVLQDAAGGGQQCSTVAVAAFGTLLAAPGPCEQQDAADNMVDLAKTLNNDPDTIKFAQIFAQQPRNSVRTIFTSLTYLY
jgi:hypothetical protein